MKQATMALLAGARPNYMKVFPLWRELRAYHPHWRPVLIHTGQHYDALMNDVFFTDFGMQRPDHFLGVGSGSHGRQTGRVMMALEELFEQERPDVLVVVGDVNSTVAGALVGTKMGIPVAHLEAGLRSGDRSMPEEINRLATDAISDLLLTTCHDADDNLAREGVPPEKVRLVGNIMIDSLLELLPRARAADVPARLDVPDGGYVCVTLHRPGNVDDPRRLLRCLEQLDELAGMLPVVFPVHPRTGESIRQTGWKPRRPEFKLVDPMGYIDFLGLLCKAGAVVTDSGGIQEETSFLGIPCLTLRPNTERPVTISEGTNRLLNPEVESLAEEVPRAIARWKNQKAPSIEYWDGKTAARVVQAIEEGLGMMGRASEQ